MSITKLRQESLAQILIVNKSNQKCWRGEFSYFEQWKGDKNQRCKFLKKSGFVSVGVLRLESEVTHWMTVDTRIAAQTIGSYGQTIHVQSFAG